MSGNGTGDKEHQLAEKQTLQNQEKDAPHPVLLASNNASLQENVRTLLAAADDLELYYCNEGVEALRITREIQPSVILQDITMPDVDGLMLVKYYRANSHTQHTPIIVLAPDDNAETRTKAFAMGANDYFAGLPDQDEMLARLRYHARAHTARLERNAALEKLRRISITDNLTGLYSRRHFDALMDQEWRRACRERCPLSLVMLDVDYFKQYNIRYGYQAGDGCLVQIADAVQSAIHRPADSAARYAGEEFAAILPNTHEHGALVAARQIQAAINALNVPHHESPVADHVTVSIGVATITPGKDTEPDSLIHACATALDQAKAQGGNRVVCSRSTS